MFTHVLEICTKKDHFFRRGYKDQNKAFLAALGFHTAMRDEENQDAVVSLWSDESVTTDEMVRGIKVPIFSCRVGELGSVALKEVDYHEATRDRQADDDDDDGETWKAGR